ncbi:mono-functional DNA-alkylating methyl methanesulfonate n-term domain-containing protein [Sarocladium implicatum]|nr:mono-functional DNA-alkylating methyl methanesulfonate n-term domain-containing protein [Sarocladium implicatum]
MAYVAPVHKPTSIRHAVRLRLLSTDQEDLVTAKANRLEVWRLTEEGLSCLHSKLVFGTISMLQRLRPDDSDVDLLFLSTDRLQYITLKWNPETNQLDTMFQAMADDAEPFMRKSQSQNKCLVDPTARFMVMHLWEGILNVFRMRPRKGKTSPSLEKMDQVRLSELWMKSSTFLHQRTGRPRIAFLYKTSLEQEEARLAVYRLTKDDKGTDVATFDPHSDERELDRVIDDPYSSILIPVPVYEEKRYHVRNTAGTKAHLGGVLVVGETLFTYFDSLTYASVQSPMKEPRIYVAWEQIDSTHYFLADDYGRLDVLEIKTATDQTGKIVTGMEVQPMTFSDGNGPPSRAASLVLLSSDILFIASHHGDSQLIRFELAPPGSSSGGSVVLLQTLSNNAPIMDFAVMDMGNREGDIQLGNAFLTGQLRIVAGCGAYQDGSLRSIRSGVGLEDRGILDQLQGTRGLFPLRSGASSSVDALAISFISETRVLRFHPSGEIEEVAEFQNLDLDRETLLAANTPRGHCLQVTSTHVSLRDPESGITLSSWSPRNEGVITAVSANDKWILLAVDGRYLVSLDMDNDLRVRESDYSTDQISCLQASTQSQCRDIGLVGSWSQGNVTIVRLDSLDTIRTESLRRTEDSASVPRDLALIQLHPAEKSGPTLLAALEDGNVVSFDVNVENQCTLSGRKTVTLGNSPARLHILPQEDGTSSVFATTEHASVIYSAEGRIIYSATTADDATFVAPFDSEAFPGSIILSTDDHIRLCSLDKERLTHVKTLSMERSVRRVAYSPELKAFGLGCVEKRLKGNEEVIVSSVKLVDEIIFQELGEQLVLDASESLELVECIIRARLPDSGGNLAERFIVGTSFVGEDSTPDISDTNGRILVLGVNEERQLYQIVSHKLRGGCRCLGVIGDKIVAGLAKTVVVYDYAETTTISGALQKLATYRPAAFPVGLDISGNMIGVIDLMQSLSLVEFIPAHEGQHARLEERARHYQAGWATAITHLEGERWLEADAQGNLMVLQRNLSAPTEHDMRRLVVTSEMNLGEQINKMQKLHIPVNEKAVVAPRAFLASTEGSLYLFGDIAPRYQDLLMKFQDRLTNFVSAPGNISFKEWRAFRNGTREGEEPERFVDGEMVERFLDLDEGKQELVCEGLGPSMEEMRDLVEELRRMH